MHETLVGYIHYLGASPVALVVKNLLAHAGDIRDIGLIPGSGRFPGEGNGNLLQYSCLENPMDGGAWCPWGHKESDKTERLHFTSLHFNGI